ncbi:MAG: sensory rhodopsin transducer [Rhodomicrobium sp.]
MSVWIARQRSFLRRRSQGNPVPIAVQDTRLDSRQNALALLSTMAHLVC